MRLTRKKAIELCIELWTWLAETGKLKDEWPEWDNTVVSRSYAAKNDYCWFCIYIDIRKKECHEACPIPKKYNMTCTPLGFGKWAHAKTIKDRKKYAKLFLKQIKTFR